MLQGTQLILPFHMASAKTETISIDEVQTIDVFDPKRGDLVIGTALGVFVYPVLAFVDPGAPVRFARAVVDAIAQGEDGEARLKGLQQRRQVELRFFVQRPRVTHAMLLMLSAMFVLQTISGAFNGSIFDQLGVMLAMGANSSLLVSQGEWWRLFVANFLHGGWLHISLNCLGLWSLGRVLERLVGNLRFMLVYLVSALGGAMASAWAAQGPFSLGASTAIFGLLGAFAVLSWRFGDQFPAGIRQSRRWWLVVLGINAVLPVVVPMIDMAAHAGGFVAGGLVMFLAYPSARRFDPLARASVGIIAATGAVALAFSYAGLTAAHYSVNPPRPPHELVLSVLDRNPDPESQNMHAWMVVTASRAYSRADLEGARARARRVVGQQRLSGYLDTLATTEYRLGRRFVAARLEREAIRKLVSEAEARSLLDNVLVALLGTEDDGRILWSQLARFLHGHTPFVEGPGRVEAVSITFEGDELVVHRPAGRPAVIFAQIIQEVPQGVLRVGIEAAASDPMRFTIPEALAEVSQGSLHLLWVDTSSAGPAGSELGLEYRAHDPAVDEFP